MRPFYDDYDELDESSFDNFAATRRLLNEKQHRHQKNASRKRRGRAHHDRWADADWDGYGDSKDCIDDSFDRYHRLRFDD